MKTASMLIVFATFLIVGSLIANAAEKSPQEVIDLAHSELVDLGTVPIIVEAVKIENAMGYSSHFLSPPGC